MVLTTHYLEEADALCQQVVIVDHGRIVAEGTPGELKANVAPAAIDIALHDPTDIERAVRAVGSLRGIGDVVRSDEGLRLYVAEGAALLPAISGCSRTSRSLSARCRCRRPASDLPE